MTEIDQLIARLRVGTQEFHTHKDMRAKLAQNRPLRIKLGADPTASDLHLGHAVVLSKLRQFQDLGHEVIFLVGDFTARIGDPTGRSKTRPPLSPEEIEVHSATYLAQVGKILDPARLTVVYNSSWLGALSSAEWVKLCGKVTLARMTEREDFAQRIAAQQPVGMHELLYPIMQGYDSVELRADVELGGSDQLFNVLMGRFLQEQFGQEPQVCMTVPLLEGLDGVQKMSKSYGNYISLQEPADQAFGKIMSISDKLMWRYYEILLHADPLWVTRTQEAIQNGQEHPLDLKKRLAFDIVARFWSPTDATHAATVFEKMVQEQCYDDAPEVNIPLCHSQTVVELIKQLPSGLSASELRRRIAAGAVSIDGEKVHDASWSVTPRSGMILKIGKHLIYRLKVQ